MSAYRMYFRASGEIHCRENFDADDDVAAIRMAWILYGACSDVCDCFELWQGPRQILDKHQSRRREVSLADLIEAHQRIVLETEERISKSKWKIAESQQLIDAIDRLKSAAKYK